MQSTAICPDPQEMIDIIQGAYRMQRGWTHRDDKIESETYAGAFSKQDNAACIRCKDLHATRDAWICADMTVARYDTGGKTIHFINFEQVLNSLPRRQGKVCDFLHYSSDMSVFVLNELTCMEHAYIFTDGTREDGSQRTGKRTMARSQLKAVIQELEAMPATKAVIDKFANCVALFSYRVKGLGHPKDAAAGSMATFINAMSPTSSLRSVANLHGRFVWEERKYPDAFIF